ncbi:hypothetical protein LXL04_035662 [Taraxacum kok-saghyz]
MSSSRRPFRNHRSIHSFTTSSRCPPEVAPPAPIEVDERGQERSRWRVEMRKKKSGEYPNSLDRSEYLQRRYSLKVPPHHQSSSIPPHRMDTTKPRKREKEGNREKKRETVRSSQSNPSFAFVERATGGNDRGHNGPPG